MILKVLILIIIIASSVQAARYAVLAGNSHGGPGLSPLKYVKKDLESVKSILVDHCSFGSENILVIYNKSPIDIEKGIDSIQTKLKNDTNDLFLFYYSGHADAQSLKLGKSEFPLQKFKDRFTSMDANIRIGIFDACQSGSFTRLKGGQLAEPFLIDNNERIEGQVILSSSSSTENAQESDLYGSSIFTFHLVNALRGSADVSADGRVTLAEAYQYSYNHTVSSTAATWGGVQHPGYQFRLQGESDIVLADLNSRKTGLVIDAEISGKMTIADMNTTIVADFVKESGTKVIIALRNGKYKVYNTTNNKNYLVDASVEDALTTVEKTRFRSVKSVQSFAKGDAGAYRTAHLQLENSFLLLSFDEISDKMNTEFASYGIFGITPSFTLPSIKYVPAINSHFFPGHKYSLRTGLKLFDINEHRIFSGKKSNGIDTVQRSYHLSVKTNLRIIFSELVCRYNAGAILDGLYGEAGMQLNYISHSVNAQFDDSLFVVSLQKSTTDKGFTVLPIVCAGYEHRLFRFLNVGIAASYRIQTQPSRLYNFNTTNNRSRYKYDLRGFGGSLILTLKP
jgi:Caspase domain